RFSRDWSSDVCSSDLTWRKRRCWGEVHDENACGVGGIAGHAGLFAAATDVARFGQAWLTRDERLQIAQPLMNEAVQEQRHNGFRSEERRVGKGGSCGG